MQIVNEIAPKDTLNVIHPESFLAHRYLDGLTGIEIGAASYQPFGLNSLNVSTGDPADRERYKAIQLAVCGSYVTVDIEAEADDIPIMDRSVDFVVASHVLEHTSNPLATLSEWDRVVRPGGYVFLIVPKRESPYGDSHRRISPIQDFLSAYDQSWDNQQAYDFMYDRPTSEFDIMRGHIWVFDLYTLIGLVAFCNVNNFFNWKLLEAHETDDTDHTGHMAIWQKLKDNPL